MNRHLLSLACVILGARSLHSQSSPNLPLQIEVNVQEQVSAKFQNDKFEVVLSVATATNITKLIISYELVYELDGERKVYTANCWHGDNITLTPGQKYRYHPEFRGDINGELVGWLIDVLEYKADRYQPWGFAVSSPEIKKFVRAEEVRLRKLRAAAKNSPTPDPSATNATAKVEKPIVDQSSSVVLIKTDQGSGTGFVCSMAGTNFIVTNAHVLQGAKQFEFRTTDNTILHPLRLELANDRDLARVTITNDIVSQLVVSQKNPVLGQSVSVFGNSLGEGVVTHLAGKVLGFGPIAIEVDAQFVSGNSGSPVVVMSNQVIGVATYLVKPGMTNWATAKTPFSEVRRFAARLQGKVDWKPVSVRQFYDEGALLQDADRLLAETSTIAKILRARRLDLLSEVAARQRGADARFHDVAIGRSLAIVCDNIQSAHAAYKKLASETSSSVQIPLRSADLTFRQLPNGLLQRFQAMKWSTAYHQDQAKEYEKIFKEWN